jgi:autotransporter-associated beta strand protein
MIVAGGMVAWGQARYYDLNGATAASGITAGNVSTWSTTSGNWSTDINGSAATANWTTGANAIFSAGADAATFNYTVNLGSNITVGNLTLNDGNLTLGLGTNFLTLNGTIPVIADASRTLTITGSTGGITGTGSNGLTKSGTGNLIISSTNTYAGVTTVTAGNLVIGSAGALGSTGNGTVVQSGGTLGLQGGITVVGEALTISGTGAGNFGSLRNYSGDNTWTNTVTMSANANITADAGGTLTLNNSTAISGTNRALTLGGAGNITISGTIATGTGALTKSGTGNVILSGNNTYTGLTTVSGGNLIVGNATALGTTANGTNVASGATLALQGNVTVAGETLTLNGTGAGAGGALRNLAGNNTWTGGITLSTTSTITSDAGTLNVNAITGASGANRALTLNGAGDTVVSGAIATVNLTVTKSGTGNVTLSSANTYSGTTTVSGGTLIVGNATALGATANGTNVANGATLALQGGIAVAGEALTLNGTGVGNAGALRNISGPNSWSRTITLSTNSTIGSDAGTLTLNNTTAVSGTNRSLTLTGAGSITVSGNVSLGTGNITRSGAGLATLSGNNTYSGGTFITSGTLRATTNANALGTGNVTLAGGTLQLANDTGLNFGRNTTVTADSTIVSDRLTTGTGVTHTLGTLSIGAATLDVTAGANVNAPTAGVTFGNTTSTGNATFAVGTNALLTLGAFSDGGSADTITKSGTGNLTFAAAGTTVNGTALNVTGGNVLLNAAGALGNLTAVSVSSTATLNLGAAQTVGSLAGSGAVALGTSNLTVGSTNNLSGTFDGSISGTGNLLKAGTGNLTLGGNSTFSGSTFVNAGNLVLSATTGPGNLTIGTGNLVVNTGGVAALLNNSGSMVVTNNVTLAGGTLRNLGGDENAFGANVTLTANSTVDSASTGNRLIIGGTQILGNELTTANQIALGTNTLTVTGSGNTIFYAAIGASGEAGNFVSNSTGTVWFNAQHAANNYTGNTIINSGTLVLGTDVNVAYNNQTIRGNLTIGNNTTSATVRFEPGYGDNKIADTSVITINAGSTLSLGDNYDNVGAINLNAGNITSGFGSLKAGGNITVGTVGANTTSTISGFQFWLSPDASTVRNIIVDPTANLQIDAQVVSGGITKLGNGTLTLNGNNTYTGITNVNAGIVKIASNTGLGGTSNGTVVAAGATLQFDRNPSYNAGANLTVAEQLTLNGTGFGGQGALVNVDGNNTLTGSTNLASNALIQSQSDRLTINGNISGVGTLTVNGTGDTWINGGIFSGAGMIKNDSGTLTLTGNSTYLGDTAINAGVVNIRHNNALGDTLIGNTIVATGAQLQIQQDAAFNGGNPVTVGNERLFLNGNGTSDTGALRNISGDNTWGGNITVNSTATRINSDSGTLNIGNATRAIAVGNNTLTLGGSGNITVNSAITAGTLGQVVKDGSGTATLSGNGTGFNGDVNVTAGTLAFGANNVLTNNTATNLTVSGNTAVLNLSNFDQTVSTLTSGNNSLIQFGANSSLTLANGVSVMGGNWTFTGDPASQSAALIVGAGSTLRLASSGQTAGGNATVNGLDIVLAGGTLEVAGTVGNYFGNLTVTGNSIIDFGVGMNSTITFTDMMLGNYTLSVFGWVDTLDYFYVTNSPGTRFNPPLNQVTFGPSGGPPWTGNNTTWLPWDTQVTPVPEPSTYGALLMAAGLSFFGWRRWRGRRVP